MLLPSIRRLALSDVDDDTLRQLVDHGESLYVERKQEPPKPPGLGASAGSFANMLGGFILLGVTDSGEVKGWKPPGRTDLQSYVGELLRHQVDPLPPYIAQMRELEGKPVGVVRVSESVDTPHVVRGTGAIYVRSSKGNEPVPVDDHQTVLAMARRGEEADRDARDRIAKTPDLRRVFGTPDSGTTREFEGAEVIARSAPLTVTPSLRDWPLTRHAADRCSEVATELLPAVVTSGFQHRRHGPELIPFGRAVGAKVVQERPAEAVDEALVLADSAGVVAAGIRRGATRGDRPSLLINAMLEDELIPLAAALLALLEEAEVVGRTLVDVWILIGDDDVPTTRGQAEVVSAALHVSREITVPADDEEIRELAEQWHREFQREVGIAKFEGESE